MAKPIVLKNCHIEVDGVTLSDNSNSVTVNRTKNEVETTSFGSGGTRRAYGLSDDSFEIQFMQAYVAGSVDSTLAQLHEDEEEFEVVVRPKGDPVGADNPEYTGTCVLLEYTPLDGAPGELSEVSVTFPAQGSISRATASS
ncbi:hypothetical protein [Streptomonospora arabica]|uniref:Phage tail protein n=1 Tax=Streptomonospora arabica TaxID=412417 RepID=A0ABV9SSP4_9ACTN